MELRDPVMIPPVVIGVLIPEKTAGEFRLLGVPTVADRIAQMVAELQIELDNEIDVVK